MNTETEVYQELSKVFDAVRNFNKQFPMLENELVLTAGVRSTVVPVEIATGQAATPTGCSIAAGAADDNHSQQVTKYQYTPAMGLHQFLFCWTPVVVQCYNGKEYVDAVGDFGWRRTGFPDDIQSWNFAESIPEGFHRYTGQCFPIPNTYKVRFYSISVYFRSNIPPNGSFYPEKSTQMRTILI